MNYIPNLVAHFTSFIGLNTKHAYTNFSELENLDAYDCILHILIDGLGYEFIQKKGNFLKQHCIGYIQSTFPSSTSVAMTSYYTGMYPGEHGFFGWNQLLPISKEVVNPLTIHRDIHHKEIDELFDNIAPFWSGTQKSVSVIIPEAYISSKYTQSLIKDCQRTSYKSLDDRKNKTIQSIKGEIFQKQYILSYRAGFDDICHKYGVDNGEPISHFSILEQHIQEMYTQIKTNSTKRVRIIITSDHGHVQSQLHHIYTIDEMLPHLQLQNPISGESRFFYLSTALDDSAIQSILDTYIGNNGYILLTIQQAINQGLYGPSFNSSFRKRIGTHIVILNDKNQVVSGKQPRYIGNHGGMHIDETRIPVIVI